jgi:hypothetical protein
MKPKMIRVFLLTLTIFVTTNVMAQKMSKDEFEKQYIGIIEQIKKENWSKSNQLSTELLSKIESNKSFKHEEKVLRYICIYTTAGLLNQKKVSKAEAEKFVAKFIGKLMIMPAHPFNSNSYVNSTMFADDENTFFSGVNNANGTKIFAFEYVHIKDGIKESATELEGKFIVLEGKLNEAFVEGNFMPRFKLKFIEGTYEVVRR